MARQDSVHRRLERVRPPRVQLSYEVEVGDAIEHKALPFVLGVIGDFVGQADPRDVPVPLKDRHFVRIDREGFDEVMSAMAPRVVCRVRNHLDAHAGELAVDLRMHRLRDFRPESVVQQVEPLRQLLAMRNHLSDLRNKLAGNDKLDALLGEALRHREQLLGLSQQCVAVPCDGE